MSFTQEVCKIAQGKYIILEEGQDKTLENHRKRRDKGR